MRFPGFCWCGLVLLTACNGPQQTYDPFLGRTTVPPPPAPVQAGPVQPYYPASPAPAAPAPSLQPSSPPPPAGAYSYPQPRQGASIPPRATLPRPNQYPAGVAAVARRAPVTQASPDVPGGGTVLAGATTPGTWPSQPAVPRTTSPAEPAVRIVPPPTEPRRLATAGDATALRGRPTSKTNVAGQTPLAASPQAKFAHAPDYRSLRGQLEYLASKQQWKIRYIPIDGQTDRYGGSVVLANASAVASFHPGDFVQVLGAVVPLADQAEPFAPTFHVERIGPIAN